MNVSSYLLGIVSVLLAEALGVYIAAALWARWIRKTLEAKANADRAAADLIAAAELSAERHAGGKVN